MNIIWLSANMLGYELLKETLALKCAANIDVVTLRKGARTVMYDGVGSERWRGLGLKVHEIKDVNREGKMIRELRPDLMVVCGWRQVVDKKIYDIPRVGTVAFHPALLPYGRGPAPIINTILKGLKISGLTMFYVNDEVDSGDIIGQERFPVSPEDHAGDVYEKIIIAGRKLVKKNLPLLISGKAPRRRQDETRTSLFKKPPSGFNMIDLKKESLDEIYRKIRALSAPYRGAYIKKGNKRLMIWKAELKDMK